MVGTDIILILESDCFKQKSLESVRSTHLNAKQVACWLRTGESSLLNSVTTVSSWSRGTRGPTFHSLASLGHNDSWGIEDRFFFFGEHRHNSNYLADQVMKQCSARRGHTWSHPEKDGATSSSFAAGCCQRRMIGNFLSPLVLCRRPAGWYETAVRHPRAPARRTPLEMACGSPCMPAAGDSADESQLRSCQLIWRRCFSLLWGR